MTRLNDETQPMHRPRHPSPAIRILVAGGLALGMALTGGCFEEDELAAAIEDVSGSLEALAAPGTAVPGEELNQSTYERAISTLRPHITDGTAAQQAAANLLIARAERGLAAGPSQRLAEVQSQIENELSSLRAEASRLVRLVALAQAAETFNPTDEIAELRSQILDRQSQAEARRASLAEVNRQIAEFDSLIADAERRADEHRAMLGTLLERARLVDAREALPLHEQAAELRRLSDRLAVEAERRRSQADLIRPQIGEIEAEIDRVTQQARLFEESIESLNQEAAEARARTESLTSEAAELRETLLERFSALTQLVEAEAAEAFDAASSRLDAAASAANRAASASRAQGRLLAAEVAQQAAQLAESQSAITTKIAAFGESLGAGEAATRLGSIAEETGRLALEQAQAALEAIERAGIRGEAADRFDRVIGALQERIGVPAADETAAESPAEQPEEAPEADATDASTEPGDG